MPTKKAAPRKTRTPRTARKTRTPHLATPSREDRLAELELELEGLRVRVDQMQSILARIPIPE